MTEPHSNVVPDFALKDLAQSGLTPQDMRVAACDANSKAATNTPMGLNAYKIPYHDMRGRLLPFYRVKVMDVGPDEPKYKQLADSGNHIYFPTGLARLLPKAQYIIITEGEKKAACAVKHGFPCVAVGGVDSWRNRNVKLSKGTQLGTGKNGEVIARLPAGAEAQDSFESLAIGFREVVNFALRRDIPIIIIYDTDLDKKDKVSWEVQRAAATLGFELRSMGVKFNRIRQLILHTEGEDEQPHQGKLGLDDFLIEDTLGPDLLGQHIHEVLTARQAFPRHPSPREYVNKKLGKQSINRNDMAKLSTTIVCDLDVNGMRLHCPDDDNMYYFDTDTHKLHRAGFTQYMDFAKTAFAKLLYDKYGVSGADQRLIQVLNSQFCAEEPIQQVRPEKVIAIRGDTLYYQISDGQMVKVDATGIRIIINGSDNVLFEGGAVTEIDANELRAGLTRWGKEKVLPNLWLDVLKEARIAPSKNDWTRQLLSLLYSISPWFYRWRLTQLPVEQMLGEAGSGKTTLYKMRQMIIAGHSIMRNAPKDLKDWTASVASAGALHVTDNVHMTGGMLKQQLSDELCRVVTEDSPHIESRKLYTDNDLVRVPVRTVFAVTAIKQPFTNTDIIQRSIIAELDKGTEVIEYDADWAGTQITKAGGRTMWVAHQLTFMYRLFQLIKKDWNPKYRARYRLINVEQLLMFAARAYGMDSTWVPHFLESSRDDATAKSDAVMEGLSEWADAVRSTYSPQTLRAKTFTMADICNSMGSNEDYSEHPILTNPRKLAAYVDDKKNTVAQITGLAETGYKYANRKTYTVALIEDPEVNLVE